MYPNNDIELIYEIKAGNIAAYEILVKRYQNKVFYFVNRIVRNDKDAEEIVQDTLYKVYTYIDKVDLHKKFSTFLFEIAKNLAISKLRSRHQTLPLNEMIEVDEDVKIYENLFQVDLSHDMHRILATLDQKYRLVIQLYYIEDLSYAEIAQKCKLPINTVRTRIKRAKLLLAKQIDYEKY
jgi:RNA polymerase sigma-70 factor, ECF subfamily